MAKVVDLCADDDDAYSTSTTSGSKSGYTTTPSADNFSSGKFNVILIPVTL